MGGVIRSCSQFYTEMIKITFAVLLVGALLVNPTHSSLGERAKAAADTALFSADVFTYVANGLNLNYGPDPNTTLNQTDVEDGRIGKAHPVWGVLMLTIPFLPMMVFVPYFAIGAAEGEG